jgi:Pyridine nucleotide-disulphide oxidoreductase
MPERIETVIIGGGQAGLSVGYHLARRGRPFLILDAGQRVGDAWRNRWDSLRLFTPARYSGLAGMLFPGPAFSFPTKDEMADYLEDYAATFRLPVRTGVRVDRLSRRDGRLVVAAGDRRWEADNVVVAMADYQRPRVPGFAAELDPGIVQLHAIGLPQPGPAAGRRRPGRRCGQLGGGDRPGARAFTPHLAVGTGRRPGPVPGRRRPARLLLRLLFRVVFLPGADDRHADRAPGASQAHLQGPAPGPGEGPRHHRRRGPARPAGDRAAGRAAGAGGRTGPGGGQRRLVHRVRPRLLLDRPARGRGRVPPGYRVRHLAHLQVR